MRKSYDQIQKEGEEYAALLADILGVKQGESLKATRSNIAVALGMKAADEVSSAEVPGVYGLKEDGTASSLDELMRRYLAGELKDSYELPASSETISAEFFDSDEYDCNGGFHPSAEAFEFTSVWYQLMAEEMELRNLGEWSVAHGGLRWEYYGELDYDEAVVIEARDAAKVRYDEFYTALQAGHVPTDEESTRGASPEVDFTVGDLYAILGED